LPAALCMAWVAKLPPNRLVTALVIFALASAARTEGGMHEWVSGRRAGGGAAAVAQHGGEASARAGMRA
jgi:hypothetical protein